MKAFTSYGMMSLAMMLLLLTGSPSAEADETGSPGSGKIIFTKHFQNTLFDVTEHASYSVEILLDDEEYAIGKNVIGVVIHDARDEDVSGAEITFVLKDLVAGKDGSTSPTVTDKGNGLYIVSGLDLQKEGKWELTVTVRKERTQDIVKFVLPEAIKARVPKGRYSP